MHSLSWRLLLAFIAIIVLTTLSAGVPAFITIRRELESQAWTRVSDGGRVTEALLEAEKTRLSDLAVLVAQRPTLQELARQQDIRTLDGYLETIQETLDLDILVLSNMDGGVLARGAQSFPSVELRPVQGAAFQVIEGTRPEIALVASHDFYVDGEEGYFITVGIILNDIYAEKLAGETGFEHSFLIGDQRVATTLHNLPSTATNPEAIRRAIVSGEAETALLDCEKAHCYVVLIPLLDREGEVVGLTEVVLPVEGLLAANRTALLVLVFSTLAVAGVTSGLAGYFARRLTAPLNDLTDAAIKISHGDLNSPVPLPDGPSEITSLAEAFEKSRVTILQALEDLSRAKSWFETLIHSVVEGIVTIDEQGIVTSFNHGAERLTGWKSSQAIGLPIDRVFPLVDNQGGFLEYIRSPGGVQQVNVRTPSGREIALAVTSAPLQSSKSGANHMALVLRDISEEEAARRLRSYFLANISHEFRTPLAALNASVELLLAGIEKLSLAEIAELLDSIHLSVTGLQTLIDNLLESTSIEAGHFRIRCRPTDLGEVITDAIRVMKPLLERRKQRLSLAIPHRIPMAQADPTRLTQVLVNLLSNASKYSPMESTIELRLHKMDGRNLRIAIIDQGPGIPLLERSKLYHSFMRLGEGDRAQVGIGLGLSVVKAIIEAHRGEVGMKERRGDGSVFWFTIPVQEEL